jgi:predicted metal-dependent hydrolase
MTATKRRESTTRTAKFRRLVERCSRRIGVRPKRVSLIYMTRKWASCSRSGRVSFALDLQKTPLRFREVVVVHELVHLLVPNHGKLFKSLMRAYLPDWESRFATRTRTTNSRRGR